jgi:hypothetical protein
MKFHIIILFINYIIIFIIIYNGKIFKNQENNQTSRYVNDHDYKSFVIINHS